MNYWKDSKSMNQGDIRSFKITIPKVKENTNLPKLNWVDGSPHLDTSEKKEIVRADGSVHYYTDTADVANEATIDFVSKDDIPAGDERYDKGLILKFISAKDGRLGDHCVGFTAKGVFSVDWGDGVASVINSSDEARIVKHYYKEEGTKTIKMLGTIDHFVSDDDASVGVLKAINNWGESEETLDKDKMYLKDRNSLIGWWQATYLLNM